MPVVLKKHQRVTTFGRSPHLDSRLPRSWFPAAVIYNAQRLADASAYPLHPFARRQSIATPPVHQFPETHSSEAICVLSPDPSTVGAAGSGPFHARPDCAFGHPSPLAGLARLLREAVAILKVLGISAVKRVDGT